MNDCDHDQAVRTWCLEKGKSIMTLCSLNTNRSSVQRQTTKTKPTSGPVWKLSPPSGNLVGTQLLFWSFPKSALMNPEAKVRGQVRTESMQGYLQHVSSKINIICLSLSFHLNRRAHWKDISVWPVPSLI